MIKLVFGCGYLGQRVAARWIEQGCQVYAVTRSTNRAAALASVGIHPIIGDVLNCDSWGNLPVAETVLFAVGYERASARSIREVYVEGLRRVLAALPHGTGRLVYVSSTGVYGQADGSWVDEDSPCQPQREGGSACLEAERLLRDSAWGGPALVLRMSGIYGPGRIPRRRELEAGRPLAAPQAGYLNLVHVDDAARAVLTAESDHGGPPVYCVSDGNPVLRGDYYRYLAQRLGAPEPHFVEPPEDSPARLRAGSSKRISSARLRNRLGFRFEYPSYREGLAAIVAAEQG